MQENALEVLKNRMIGMIKPFLFLIHYNEPFKDKTDIIMIIGLSIGCVYTPVNNFNVI